MKASSKGWAQALGDLFLKSQNSPPPTISPSLSLPHKETHQIPPVIIILMYKMPLCQKEGVHKLYLILESFPAIV